jgi:hypothetical protein
MSRKGIGLMNMSGNRFNKKQLDQKLNVFSAYRFICDLIDTTSFEKIEFLDTEFIIKDQLDEIKVYLLSFLEEAKYSFNKETRPDFILRYCFEEKKLTIIFDLDS